MSRVCKDLSLAYKLEILDKIKLQPPCRSRLLQILGIPKSTIVRIQFQKQFLRTSSWLSDNPGRETSG